MQRDKCPCCGFPTLEERGNFEICELCHWEDDGQDDPYADEVWGGPNGDYSLTEARRNFKENLIMYKDRRNIHSQTDKEIETKKSLINAFGELDKYEQDSLEYKSLWSKIKSYEKILNEIVDDKTERYSNNVEKNENACKLINSDDTDEVVNGLLGLALNSDDLDFIQDIMTRYSEHENAKIRGTAILCFGHIAKIHEKISKKLVLPIINQGLKDESSFVREQSRSALDDINFYIK
ncbi:Cysteine-rich CPCC [Bacillus sp. OV166]|uniref:CPCC family cysteine-rich protein n=1 Tax=Bacillus sp. OV166 TaxID=1882763 RepID=UPI000A2ADE60|nr:CPCC family cysteine-rich protein [Bacillus sp. OV166]SMQ77504.1 Cysteine-rich CPCC [Bacillus sp. OV166]